VREEAGALENCYMEVGKGKTVKTKRIPRELEGEPKMLREENQGRRGY
jgi:hypothetical protein